MCDCFKRAPAQRIYSWMLSFARFGKAERQRAVSLQDFDHKTMVTQIKKLLQDTEAADVWAIKAARRFLVPVSVLRFTGLSLDYIIYIST